MVRDCPTAPVLHNPKRQLDASQAPDRSLACSACRKTPPRSNPRRARTRQPGTPGGLSWLETSTGWPIGCADSRRPGWPRLLRRTPLGPHRRARRRRHWPTRLILSRPVTTRARRRGGRFRSSTTLRSATRSPSRAMICSPPRRLRRPTRRCGHETGVVRRMRCVVRRMRCVVRRMACSATLPMPSPRCAACSDSICGLRHTGPAACLVSESPQRAERVRTGAAPPSPCPGRRRRTSSRGPTPCRRWRGR
jgi:hypothetical protein